MESGIIVENHELNEYSGLSPADSVRRMLDELEVDANYLSTERRIIRHLVESYIPEIQSTQSLTSFVAALESVRLQALAYQHTPPQCEQLFLLPVDYSPIKGKPNVQKLIVDELVGALDANYDIDKELAQDRHLTKEQYLNSHREKFRQDMPKTMVRLNELATSMIIKIKKLIQP